MALSHELQGYAENIWRRFPEIFISLGSPDVEDFFDLHVPGSWRHSITDTRSEKVIEIVLPRRGGAGGTSPELGLADLGEDDECDSQSPSPSPAGSGARSPGSTHGSARGSARGGSARGSAGAGGSRSPGSRAHRSSSLASPMVGGGASPTPTLSPFASASLSVGELDVALASARGWPLGACGGGVGTGGGCGGAGGVGGVPGHEWFGAGPPAHEHIDRLSRAISRLEERLEECVTREVRAQLLGGGGAAAGAGAGVAEGGLASPRRRRPASGAGGGGAGGGGTGGGGGSGGPGLDVGCVHFETAALQVEDRARDVAWFLEAVAEPWALRVAAEESRKCLEGDTPRASQAARRAAPAWAAAWAAPGSAGQAAADLPAAAGATLSEEVPALPRAWRGDSALAVRRRFTVRYGKGLHPLRTWGLRRGFPANSVNLLPGEAEAALACATVAAGDVSPGEHIQFAAAQRRQQLRERSTTDSPSPGEPSLRPPRGAAHNFPAPAELAAPEAPPEAAEAPSAPPPEAPPEPPPEAPLEAPPEAPLEAAQERGGGDACGGGAGGGGVVVTAAEAVRERGGGGAGGGAGGEGALVAAAEAALVPPQQHYQVVSFVEAAESAGFVVDGDGCDCDGDDSPGAQIQWAAAWRAWNYRDPQERPRHSGAASLGQAGEPSAASSGLPPKPQAPQAAAALVGGAAAALVSGPSPSLEAPFGPAPGAGPAGSPASPRSGAGSSGSPLSVTASFSTTEATDAEASRAPGGGARTPN